MIDLQALFRIGDDSAFERAALDVFRFQAERCEPYREYLRLIGIRPERVETTREIPFLPDRAVQNPADLLFRQRAPAGVYEQQHDRADAAKHYVADLSIYEQAFTLAFERFYGPVDRMAIFALLPSYLEREGSSLIYMADRLIRQGGGGFYLHDHDALLRDPACAPGTENPARRQLCAVGFGRPEARSAARNDRHGDRRHEGAPGAKCPARSSTGCSVRRFRCRASIRSTEWPS